MRHAPERVADAACGVFGLKRHDLYARDEFGVRRKTAEFTRMRSLVVKCIRRISGASFPRIAKMLGVASHSSIHNAYASEMTTDDEQSTFDLMVIGKLVALDPRAAETKNRRNAVWFSPACEDVRQWCRLLRYDVRRTNAAPEPAPELPSALGEEGRRRGRVQGGGEKRRGQAEAAGANGMRYDPTALLDANLRMPRR